MTASVVDFGENPGGVFTQTQSGVQGFGMRFRLSVGAKCTALRWGKKTTVTAGAAVGLWRVSDGALIASGIVPATAASNTGGTGYNNVAVTPVDLAAGTDYVIGTYSNSAINGGNVYTSSTSDSTITYPHNHTVNDITVTTYASRSGAGNMDDSTMPGSDNTNPQLEFWFGLGLSTNSPPTNPGTPSVSVTAADSATVSWAASTDPDGDAVQYFLEYESSATTRVRVANNITGTSTVVDLSGYPASNNARFYVLAAQNPDIGVYNSAGWIVSADFKLNKPPTVPTLAGGAKSAQNPTLSATATDPNGDTWRAYFQIATDSGFTNVVDQGYGSTVPSGSGSTRRGAVLSPGSTYYYRALAEDSGGEQSAYAAGVSFTTPAALSQTFAYTGGVQTFVVPAGVTSLIVDAYGAEGGSGLSAGGQGGRTQGSITVTPGETLSIYVGGKGGNGSDTANGPAGYNGGGANVGGGSYKGGSGGGATDIRRVGTALTDRVLVAAGGGGGAGASGLPGGAGGGLTGNPGALVNDPVGNPTQSTGGTQTAGGNVGGLLGVGGSTENGGFTTPNASNGAGGGGYYGGGSGNYAYLSGGSYYSIGNCAGAGGSALVPAGGSTTAGGRTGDGVVTLTYADVVETANNAPNAPGSPFSPAAGAAINGDDERTFSWTHSDPDGDGQGGYSLRRTNVTTGVVEYWTGTGWSGTATYVQTASQSVVLPANAFQRGSYTWAVSTTDVYGSPGPYSANRALVVNGTYSTSS